ncbi:uncharacterized protein LOC111806135 isoform X2 [Cucurbita pepo subsp. pepo]|uniref:uncharacterized protein LOC111806135 isoform X2 n=1 Tax=Cucurbita pepo subsp. pepo TaxID=3664 RepID=UPI000C9D86A4|nr:uncharacterized protein LOC111806135 isoform X2 [Cucurbita pepo subsp. pepo]
MAYTVGSSTPICSFNPSSKPTSVPHKAFRIIEAFQSTNPIRLLPCAAKVLSYVLSVKEQELIQWIISMDSSKLVAYAGSAGIDEQTLLALL